MECPICCEPKLQLFQIANCEHRFCLDCCLTHINTKSQLFTDILCPDSNCKQPFNKNAEIMSKLPAKTIQNIKKIERFAYLASHPELKPCSVVNCEGLINLKQSKKICNVCATVHCPKCLKFLHEGVCIMDENDRLMKSLAYQKCPSCSIWVQKKEGCNYVDCKCGNTFCYTCGINFAQDPCRLTQIWNMQLQIRNLLFSYRYKFPEQKKYYPILIVKIPLQILAFLFYTMFFSLFCMILFLILLCLLIGFSPLIVIILSCLSESYSAVIITLLILPVAIPLAILLILLIFFLYPFTRKCNHHGVYDGFDVVVYTICKFYLQGAICLFGQVKQ